MTLSHLQQRLLSTLLGLARGDVRASKARLAAELGVSDEDVARELVFLERRGLVDAKRVRLTFLGLASAAAAVSERAPRLRVAA